MSNLRGGSDPSRKGTRMRQLALMFNVFLIQATAMAAKAPAHPAAATAAKPVNSPMPVPITWDLVDKLLMVVGILTLMVSSYNAIVNYFERKRQAQEIKIAFEIDKKSYVHPYSITRANLSRAELQGILGNFQPDINI